MGLIITSGMPRNHPPFGPYDHSNKGVGYDPTPRNNTFFDVGYFQRMMESNFTLCPGGDTPWSLRFYEAIMAGSIPVIHSHEEDLEARAFWFNRLGYTYFTSDQVANHNMSSAVL